MGVVLPKKEIDLANLTAQQIMNKIEGFYNRDPYSCDDLTEAYFLELLASYPVSMCGYNMSETLKLLVAFVYFYSEPSEDDIRQAKEYAKANNCKMSKLGFTFDELACLFDRSKGTIHEAIKQKEIEAKTILQDAQLRRQAKQQAVEELKAHNKGEVNK